MATDADVIKGLEKLIWEVEHNSLWLPEDTSIRNAIVLLKRAHRKKGKWIDGYYCSECLWMHEDNNHSALITTYNFCPYCGADMRGEQG